MIERITIRTTARQQLLNITSQISGVLAKSGITDGLCVVFTPHTTAAITINENADSEVQSDILRKLAAVFPQQDKYRHAEGNSDAHIKSSLIGCSETIIVSGGKPLLGTWQGIYFCEFDGPRQRECLVKLLAD